MTCCVQYANAALSIKSEQRIYIVQIVTQPCPCWSRIDYFSKSGKRKTEQQVSTQYSSSLLHWASLGGPTDRAKTGPRPSCRSQPGSTRGATGIGGQLAQNSI